MDTNLTKHLHSQIGVTTNIQILSSFNSYIRKLYFLEDLLSQGSWVSYIFHSHDMNPWFISVLILCWGSQSPVCVYSDKTNE